MKTTSDNRDDRRPTTVARREVLLAGAGMAVAPFLAGTASGAEPVSNAAPAGNGPVTTRAYGATTAAAPLAALNIQRRPVGPHDVLLDVLYCGICHSDIHQIRDEWSDWGPTTYPCVPGHEIVGRVSAVGEKVTKFKVGDIGGVGCMVDSCRTCDSCRADREQNCEKGATFTYNAPDKHGTAPVTYGGYSTRSSSRNTSSSASRRAWTSRPRPRCCAPGSPRSRPCSTGGWPRASGSA